MTVKELWVTELAHLEGAKVQEVSPRPTRIMLIPVIEGLLVEYNLLALIC